MDWLKQGIIKQVIFMLADKLSPVLMELLKDFALNFWDRAGKTENCFDDLAALVLLRFADVVPEDKYWSMCVAEVKARIEMSATWADDVVFKVLISFLGEDD